LAFTRIIARKILKITTLPAADSGRFPSPVYGWLHGWAERQLLTGLLATLLAWKMQNIIDILLLAFTITSAALFAPTIAALIWKKTDSAAAFWSIMLSLSTVIVWKVAVTYDAGDIFAIDPLWPGLAVSFLTFVLLQSISARSAVALEQ
jgi:Na+/pantothenate symporter